MPAAETCWALSRKPACTVQPPANRPQQLRCAALAWRCTSPGSKGGTAGSPCQGPCCHGFGLVHKVLTLWRTQTRDREGAKQDLTDSCLAYKRKQLQVRTQTCAASAQALAQTASHSLAGRVPLPGLAVHPAVAGRGTCSLWSLQHALASLSSSTTAASQPEQAAARTAAQHVSALPPPQATLEGTHIGTPFGALLFTCNGRGKRLCASGQIAACRAQLGSPQARLQVHWTGHACLPAC